jgi:hypothetical protein
MPQGEVSVNECAPQARRSAPAVDVRQGPSGLPPGAIVLHVGPPKSGTTTIQAVASRNREKLLAAGVRYPGSTFNHRIQISALMGRQTGWGDGARQQPLSHWQRLVDEVRSETERRILLSSEFVSECDDDQAARFRAELGPDLHVVVTLRCYAEMLASGWQEYVKTGSPRTLDTWLRDTLAGPTSRTSPGFQRRSDYAGLIRRWVHLLGPQNVTVVMADRRHPHQLTDAFADLLCVPRGLFRPNEADRLTFNRSLTLPEAEMFRAMNVLVRTHEIADSRHYDRMVRGGAVARVQRTRTPGPLEPPVLLPAWAARRAARRAEEFVEGIAATGCRIVGDLEALKTPAPVRPRTPEVSVVPVGVAAQALAGALAASIGQDVLFGAREGFDLTPASAAGAKTSSPVPSPGAGSWRRAHRDLAAVPTPDLLRAALVRPLVECRRAVQAAARGELALHVRIPRLRNGASVRRDGQRPRR